MYSNPYVPDNCPISPYKDEDDTYCPECGRKIVDGDPHVRCWV